MFQRSKNKRERRFSLPQLPQAALINYQLVFRTALLVTVLYLVFITICDIAIFKRHLQNRWTAVAERIFPYPAAIANKEIIPLERFRREVSARKTYAAKHNIPGSESDIEKLVINQLVNRTLYAQELKRQGLSVSDKDIQQKLDDIYKQAGGQSKLEQFISENYGSDIHLADFKVWIQDSLVESIIEQQLLTRATVRHILIAVPENATADQITAAKARADEIRAKITDVSQFSDIAKQYSEDLASRDKGGSLGTTVRGDDQPVFSKDFEDAIFSLPIGTISQPIQSHYGWHIVIVDKREGGINKSMATFTKDLRASNSVRLFVGQ